VMGVHKSGCGEDGYLGGKGSYLVVRAGDGFGDWSFNVDLVDEKLLPDLALSCGFTNAAGLCGGSDGGVMGIVGSGGELQEMGEMELWRVAGKKVVYSVRLNMGEKTGVYVWSGCGEDGYLGGKGSYLVVRAGDGFGDWAS
nr:hypothetical protein [Tanacetum cinerariifolium]